MPCKSLDSMSDQALSAQIAQTAPRVHAELSDISLHLRPVQDFVGTPRREIEAGPTSDKAAPERSTRHKTGGDTPPGT